MTDTEFLDCLLNIRLPFVTGNGQQICIRFADVPEVLLGDLKKFIKWGDCPSIAGELCVMQDQWDRFLRESTASHHRKMLKASLTLGIEGPTENDLLRAPLLKNWIATWHPGWRSTVLIGTPSGHPVCIGPITRTSPLCGIDLEGKWARTQSRWYRLMDASKLEALQAAFPSQMRGARALGMAEVQANIHRAREKAGLV